MEMMLGDLVDRLSILILKCERIGDSQLGEYFKYSREVLLNVDPDHLTVAIVKLRELYDVNKTIWDYESDIRSEKESELGLEEVGRRAIKIRGFNKQRIGIKNDVSLMAGDPMEIKKDHGSE